MNALYDEKTILFLFLFCLFFSLCIFIILVLNGDICCGEWEEDNWM